MSNPRKKPVLVDPSMDLPKDYGRQFDGKSLDEVMATMANDQKIELAAAVLNQIRTTGDPTSLRILQAALERQGFAAEKELPITDARFKEIIRTAAGRL